jgi:hypothetical protein
VKSVFLLVAVAACGTPPPTWQVDAGACVPYMAPPMDQLMTPAVSFKTDVMPIFGASCASSSCHGIADSPKGGLFLGAELAHGSDAQTVHDALVGMPSQQLPMMSFIAPSDPANSYLMHKLDADQCQFQTQCVASDCLKTMPYDVGQLAVEKRDTVRRWIAQGAPAE